MYLPGLLILSLNCSLKWCIGKIDPEGVGLFFGNNWQKKMGSFSSNKIQQDFLHRSMGISKVSLYTHLGLYFASVSQKINQYFAFEINSLRNHRKINFFMKKCGLMQGLQGQQIHFSFKKGEMFQFFFSGIQNQKLKISEDNSVFSLNQNSRTLSALKQQFSATIAQCLGLFQKIIIQIKFLTNSIFQHTFIPFIKNMIESLTILTYNTFLRPPPVKTNEDDYKNERFQDIVNRLDSFDIVCFQQLFQTATFRVENMIQQGIKKGFQYFVGSESPSFWSGPATNSGLCVLSKFPIIEGKFESYNIGVLSDAGSDKGYIYCKIDINGSTLHLFNTHLQASYNNSANENDRQVAMVTRFHQLKILRAKILQIFKNGYKKEDLVLLVGDLNVNARNQKVILAGNSQFKLKNSLSFNEYEQMIEVLQTEDSFQVQDYLLVKYGGHPITFGEKDKVLTAETDQNSKQRLDYILHIKVQNQKPILEPVVNSCLVEKFEVTDRPYTQLSDHYGVSINLKVP